MERERVVRRRRTPGSDLWMEKESFGKAAPVRSMLWIDAHNQGTQFMIGPVPRFPEPPLSDLTPPDRSMTDTTPRFRIIARRILAGIEAGAWPDGRLPSRRELERAFSTSRKTIEAALSELERGRWITRPARKRPVIVQRNAGFEQKLDSFLARSGFRPPMMNASAERMEAQRLTNASPDAVIDLSTVFDREWDGGLNIADDLAAAQPALEAFRTGAGTRELLSPSGLLEIREAVCEFLAKHSGIEARPEEVLIVSRRLTAYRLLSEVLIGPTTELWAPEISLMRHYGVGEGHSLLLRPLPVDDEGRFGFDAFELSARPKVLMLETDGAAPTGGTLSALERRRVVESARRSGSFVVADSFSRLLSEKELPPVMMTFDAAKETVIMIGGLPAWITALGSITFIVANERIIRLLRASGRREYLTPDVWSQLVASKLIGMGLLPGMIERFHDFHRARLAQVEAILARHLDGLARWRLPAGFGNVWVDLEGKDVRRIWRRRRGIDYRPGWLWGEKEPRHIVLKYTLRLDRFEEGVRRLAADIREFG